jgi:starch synthase (maltosyl-transferring)
MATEAGWTRVAIEQVTPEIDGGRFPVKRVIGEQVVVEADVFTDGHDAVAADLLYRSPGDESWSAVSMRSLVNDRWRGAFTVEEMGRYHYTVRGWVNHFSTWRHDLKKRIAAGEDIRMDLLIGVDLIEKTLPRALVADKEKLAEWASAIKRTADAQQAAAIALREDFLPLMRRCHDERLVTTYGKQLEVAVDPAKAGFSTWYEFFPRSWGSEPGTHGTLRDGERLLQEIARMGFDVVYLPPIHPIGETNRKGKNNAPQAESSDAGSPWAIGSADGGHKSIHPALGTMADLERFVQAAREHGIDVALDLAFQCSMDHPYIAEHPEWFRWRPDGTIQYAENPPKKYQDVVPFHFETEHWSSLWDELKSIVLFWVDKGIRIFRVDNPHSKSFEFWEWLIGEIRTQHPDILFLAEAFTRPKVMSRLAKIGFSQSYTYFTWRNTKQELTAYVSELTQTDLKEYFRPNFWPNTPDILPEVLQYGGRETFVTRLVLAATLSSNYGIYGPAFELCVGDGIAGKEEYLSSEKYEIKQWNWGLPGNLKDLIARVNRIRRQNPALQKTGNVTFYECDNDQILFYGKTSEDLSNVLLILVNLDPFHTQSGSLRVPLDELGITAGQSYLLHELLGDEKYIWHGEWNNAVLNPQISPAQIYLVHRRMRREADFDYFM